MSPSSKSAEVPKHRKTISLQMKYQILQEHETGIKVNALARRFKLPHSTVSTILKNKNRFLDQIKNENPMDSITIRLRDGLVPQVEKVLMPWLNEQERGSLTQSMITFKALEICRDLKEKGDVTLKNLKFSASNGWFMRFCRRSGFKLKKRQSDSNSPKDSTDELTPKTADAAPVESLAVSPLEPEIVIKVEPVDYDEGASTSADPPRGEFILPHDEGEWPSTSQSAPSTSRGSSSTSSNAPIAPLLEFPVEKQPIGRDHAYADTQVVAAKPKKKKGTPKTDVANINEKRKRDNELSESGVVLDTNYQQFSQQQRPKDEFDVFGEYVAMELRQMDWKTRAFLQKAIGDLMFDAKMGKFRDQGSVPN